MTDPSPFKAFERWRREYLDSLNATAAKTADLLSQSLAPEIQKAALVSSSVTATSPMVDAEAELKRIEAS